MGRAGAGRRNAGLRCAMALLGAALSAQAQAQGQVGNTTVYRCGSSYSSTPCPGGSAVDAGDARSAAQRREAQAVKQRDAALADQLAAERRARERAAAGQQAIGIGPATASAPAAKASAGKTKPQKYKKVPARTAPGTASPPATGTR
ncbi:MAG: hypothetical protein JNL87_03350 [Burkholderiaceae bacterium]|nr:hypothetical protein [Burkholderiaceae bacterium]